MPTKNVKNLIVKLATDKDYRKEFFESENKEKILSDMGFSKEEKQTLLNLTPDRVEEFIATNDTVNFSDIRI